MPRLPCASCAPYGVACWEQWQPESRLWCAVGQAARDANCSNAQTSMNRIVNNPKCNSSAPALCGLGHHGTLRTRLPSGHVFLSRKACISGVQAAQQRRHCVHMYASRTVGIGAQVAAYLLVESQGCAGRCLYKGELFKARVQVADVMWECVWCLHSQFSDTMIDQCSTRTCELGTHGRQTVVAKIQNTSSRVHSRHHRVLLYML